MKNRAGVFAAIAAVLVISAAGFFLFGRHLAERSASPPANPSSAPAATDLAETPQKSAPAMSAPPANSIEALFVRLQSGRATDADLDALRAELLAMNPEQASALIRAFLESGRDIKTNEEFTIGPGGILTGAPTFRTFLLDLLGQLSRKTRSNLAAALSRQILEQKTSSDEWAIALRNVAWAEPQSKNFVAGKVREMLAYGPWTAEPSPGLLEAFDAIVFSADPTFIPDLSNLLSNGDDALRRASAVALDRLSEMAPLEVMNYLNANPTELADKPFLRADYYAKADLKNPSQRTALETYLSRTDVSAAEKTKLLKALATPASFVSENLITAPPTPEADDSEARQQQLSQVLAQWQAQRRFPALQREMAEVQQRIGR